MSPCILSKKGKPSILSIFLLVVFVILTNEQYTYALDAAGVTKLLKNSATHISENLDIVLGSTGASSLIFYINGKYLGVHKDDLEEAIATRCSGRRDYSECVKDARNSALQHLIGPPSSERVK